MLYTFPEKEKSCGDRLLLQRCYFLILDIIALIGQNI